MHLQLAAQLQYEYKNKNSVSLSVSLSLSLSLSPLLHLFVEIKVRPFFKKKKNKSATIQNWIWNNVILYSDAKHNFTLNIPF